MIGFFLGLVLGLFGAYISHQYAMARDEWNAGKDLRRCLNLLMEGHRFVLKNGQDKGKEYCEYIRNHKQSGENLKDYLNARIYEFSDFLSVEEQQAFHDLWATIRDRINALERLCPQRETRQGSKLQINREWHDEEQVQKERKKNFNKLGELVPQLKDYTLKRRRSLWFDRLFSWLNSQIKRIKRYNQKP